MPVGRPEFFREHGLVFGAMYASPVIVPDGTAPPPVANSVTDYFPNARPGSRAPHLWLERDGQRHSSLDLFGRDMVLLTGRAGQGWCEVARHLAAALRAPRQAYRVGAEGDWQDPERVWSSAFGVDEDGAVLVRPDGYVAWRCPSGGSDAMGALGAALATVLCSESAGPGEGQR
jgi:hypothetical protein